MARHLFISFANEDRKFRDALVKHLAPPIHSGKLAIDDSTKVGFGRDSRAERLDYLEAADVIVFLVSPNLLASKETMEFDLKKAIRRSESEKTPIVPILITETVLDGTWFHGRGRLPKEGGPIERATNDRALAEVVRALHSVLDDAPLVQKKAAGAASMNTGRKANEHEHGNAAPPAGATRSEETAWLPQATLRDLADAAIHLSLSPDTLLSGLPNALVGQFKRGKTVAENLVTDLNLLNTLAPLPNGLPLVSWLETAISLSSYRHQQQTFKKALQQIAEAARSGQTVEQREEQAQEPLKVPPQPSKKPGELRLNGKQFKRLCEVLSHAFPDYGALGRMVRFELNAKLGDISPLGPMPQVTFDLASWAESRGKLRALVFGAREQSPDNPELNAFVEEIENELYK